jgi:hypothetical protein
MENLLRVKFPQPSAASGLMPTMGTEILTEDGVKIHGVTKVVLIGEVNNVWRAEIHCLVAGPEITDLATFKYERYIPSRWQRFKRWLSFGLRWIPEFKAPQI